MPIPKPNPTPAKQRIAIDLWNGKHEELLKTDFLYISRNHPSEEIREKAKATASTARRYPERELLGPDLKKPHTQFKDHMHERVKTWCKNNPNFSYDELYEKFASGYISTERLVDWVQELYKTGELKERIKRPRNYTLRVKAGGGRFPGNPYYGL